MLINIIYTIPGTQRGTERARGVMGETRVTNRCLGMKLVTGSTVDIGSLIHGMVTTGNVHLDAVIPGSDHYE